MPVDWQVEEETPVASDPSQIKQMVSSAAKKYGVPENLALGVASHESNFDPYAKHLNDNGTKDWGVMQLNDTTVKTMGVQKPLDAAENIDAGVKLLGQHLARYGGDQKKALWAYADGPGAVESGNLHPHVKDFVDYVAGYGQPKAQSTAGWEVESEEPLSSYTGPGMHPPQLPPGLQPGAAPGPGMHAPQLPAALSGPQPPSFTEGVKSILKYPGGAAQIIRQGMKQPLIPFSKALPEGEIPEPTEEQWKANPIGAAQQAAAASKAIQGAARGVATVAEQLTTPENIALMAGSEGLGVLPKVGGYLPRALSGYFSYGMLKDVYEKYPQVKKQVDAGDTKGAAQTIAELASEGALGAVGIGQGVFDVTGRIGRATEAHNVEAERRF